MDSKMRSLADMEDFVYRLRSLDCDERLEELQKSPKVLIDLVHILNCDLCPEEERLKLKGEKNPLTCILSVIKPQYRFGVLKHTDGFYTALHAACEKDDSDTIQCIISSVGNLKQREDLLAISCNGCTPLHAAAHYSGETTVNCLLQDLTSHHLINALKTQDQYGDTPFNAAIVSGNKKVALLLMSILQKEFMTDDTHAKESVAKILCCSVGETAVIIKFWMDICSSKKQQAVETLYKSSLTSRQKCHLLSLSRCFDDVVGDREAAKCNPRKTGRLVDLMLCELDPFDRVALLRSENELGGTVLHTAATGVDAVLQKLMEYVVQPDKIPGFTIRLIRQNAAEQGAEWGACEVIEVLGEIMPDYMLAELMMITNNFGRTVLHTTVTSDEERVMLELLKLIVERLKDYCTEELLLTCDIGGHTFLHYATKYSVEKVIQYLLKEIQPQIIKKLLCAKNHEHMHTPLYKALDNQKDDAVLLNLLIYIVYYQAKLNTKEALMCQDHHSWTFLHRAAERGAYEVIEDVGKIVPSDMLAELMMITDSFGRTVLHTAVTSDEERVMLELLKLITERLKEPDALQVLKSQDTNGDTFLHEGVRNAPDETVRNIVAVLPKELAKPLTKVRNKEGVKARDVIEYGLKKDYVSQIGSLNTEIYPLATPPRVLIFYRIACNEQQNAEDDKNCVEKYFREQDIPCDSIKDPSSEEIRNRILATLSDKDLSALMVFVIANGTKGTIGIAGEEDGLEVQDIVETMGRSGSSVPKVLVVQTCHNEPSSGNSTGVMDLADSVSDRHPETGSHIQSKSLELRYPDFVIYNAAISGHKARPNVMIPCLMNSLRNMKTSSCFTEACGLTNTKIKKRTSKECEVTQTPILFCTLKHKLVITKQFLPNKI